MRLYHGSNIAVKEPKILESNRALDFGTGFYLTTDLNQAINWARVKTERRGEGTPIVSVFEFDDNNNNLRILRFDEPNKDWLRFISKNRKNECFDNEYDVIIGPVANDNTLPVINLYLSNQYTEEEAVKRLLPQKLKDQIVFKTDKSLNYIKFIEVRSNE